MVDGVTAGLIGLNAVGYGSLAIGALQYRRQLPVLPKDGPGLFAFLDALLARVFPDLPPGFTWREGFQRLRSLDLDVDWAEIERTLSEYEAYRYGGAPRVSSGSWSELVKMIKRLRSKRGAWRRS